MVLTRRAARANNSIIRWLPNEVLAAIMADASTADLRALCSTSRLIRNITTPLLYRTVILSTVPQVKCFVRTMKRRAGSSSPLARHVRQFSMTDVGNPDFNIPWSLFKGITSVISDLFNLEELDLLILLDRALEFAEMLLFRAYFPNLMTFRYAVQWMTSVPYSCRISSRTMDPSSVISSITRDTTSINYACILWHDVDDLDVDVPLLHLSRLGSPATVIGVSTSDRLRDATILAGVATHIPHVEILALRRTGITAAARITYKFTCLSVLELRDVDRGDDPHDDRGTILLWGGACKSLSSIGLSPRIVVSIIGSLTYIPRWKTLEADA
ncbi:hypothetical protein B0H14DRAFT_2985329, partial [Mycena olivaceomarginata]